MKAFLISGIGADHRMFQFLRLPETFTIVHITWQAPEKNEPLADYAWRLFKQHETAEPFILLGISFGGMIAVEIAKKFNPLHTIIIGSIPIAEQLPRVYQIAGKLRMHIMLHPNIFKYMTVIKQQIIMKSRSNKTLIRQITMGGNNQVIEWGLSAVLNWTNNTIPSPLVHIHGSKDSVFPISNSSPTHTINGGHMLTLENNEEINSILEQVLNKEEFLLAAN